MRTYSVYRRYPSWPAKRDRSILREISHKETAQSYAQQRSDSLKDGAVIVYEVRADTRIVAYWSYSSGYLRKSGREIEEGNYKSWQHEEYRD